MSRSAAQILIINNYLKERSRPGNMLVTGSDRSLIVFEAEPGVVTRAVMRSDRTPLLDCVWLDDQFPDIDVRCRQEQLRGDSQTPRCAVIVFPGVEAESSAAWVRLRRAERFPEPYLDISCQ